ncbi:MerC domain-containing protein [Marinibactrum halimedae]|uniref:MerC domain-containing protein n=1 Tax=Marinibactrum halimedae TaxID=1444977 RepID=A0AA37WPZ1_9GAMM|nr:MerC domain-containing protein [Marinibactrum halimedae]MCD9460375.1 MerC domain-containing protein [Marinibactrum halimedae]GLS26812.1 hypothetical protein GCM10007877_25310 [Marinibactrum halimedae]
MKDHVASLCSGLCLLHCLLAPFVIALGGLGIISSILSSEWVHILLVIPVVILVLLSIPSGYLQHRHYLPGLLAISGLLSVFGGLWFEEQEVIFTAAGSLLLIAGHQSNRYFSLARPVVA